MPVPVWRRVLSCRKVLHTRSVLKFSANCANRFPKWKVIPDVKESKINLYYMGNSPINVQYQVIVLSDGSYSFVFMGQPKILNFDNSVIPPAAHDKNQLYLLMKSPEKLQVCFGVSVEKYQDLLPDNDNTPVYKTTSGDPAAFVESVPAHYCKKRLRSTKCVILIQGVACCKACVQTNHYMRTLKSRSNNIDHSSKHSRYGYMS
jgi:hypothetical protein